MIQQPLCQRLACGVDVSRLKAFTDGVPANKGLQFPDGRFYQFDRPINWWWQLTDLIGDCIAPHVGRPVIGMVNLFRAGPGDDVPIHVDRHMADVDLEYPIQLHLVISAAPGCEFFIADQTIQQCEGDLWRICETSRIPHGARNRSDRDRTLASFNVVYRRE